MCIANNNTNNEDIWNNVIGKSIGDHQHNNKNITTHMHIPINIDELKTILKTFKKVKSVSIVKSGIEYIFENDKYEDNSN